jgi:hypothetical protein
MPLFMWSCFFLTAVTLICAVGLLSSVYRENLFQNLGMFLLMIGCSSRIVAIWRNGDVPFDWFLVHAGMGLFAMGVFWRVCLRERRDRFASFVHSAGVNLRDRFASNADVSHAWRQFEEGRLDDIPQERRQNRRVQH